MKCVAIVDDDPRLRELIRDELIDEGVEPCYLFGRQRFARAIRSAKSRFNFVGSNDARDGRHDMPKAAE